ncbi:MAG TPA: GNAT family N-acetyltransferase [Bryobacteraceae bacterium]|nr:GNAT family N-acetyltransferase [Bryobacteraceae bacterium]
MENQTVVLRPATRGDASGISALFQEAFREFRAHYTPAAFAATVQSESGVLARLGEGPVWVAERGHTLIGTVGALCEPDSVVVRGVAVHPSARGLGVGRRLLECTELFARECAADRLSLYTTGFLTQAIRLYQVAGFEFTGRTINPHGVELLHMVKDLGATTMRS